MQAVSENKETGPLSVFYSNLYDHIKTLRLHRTGFDWEKRTNLSELFDSTKVSVDENCDKTEIILHLLNLDSTDTQIPPILIEAYLIFDSTEETWNEENRVLIERWTLSKISNNTGIDDSANLLTYLNLYLEKGEISQFIDEYPKINTCLKISTSFEETSKFVDRNQLLSFPTISCDNENEVFSISVEWISLRMNVTLKENMLYYQTSEFLNSKIFQLTLQSQDVEQKKDSTRPEPQETGSPYETITTPLKNPIGKLKVSLISPKINLLRSPSPAPFSRFKVQEEVSGDVPASETNPPTCSKDPTDPEALKEMIGTTSLNSPNRLIGSYLENILSTAFHPVGFVKGFKIKMTSIRRSRICEELTLPVISFFFGKRVNNVNISPYLGYVDLRHLTPGYKIRKSGMIQIILFSPENLVKKLFLIKYDFTGMPPNSLAFIRHIIKCAPVDETVDPEKYESFLQYCVLLRVQSTEKNDKYIFQDIRIIFPSQPLEIQCGDVKYDLIPKTYSSYQDGF